MRIFKRDSIRYVGKNGHQVWRICGNQSVPLSLRTDLINHSPTGFSWGYNGSGPAQLALAILADATKNDNLAMDIYQEFKKSVVSQLPIEWELSREEILEWIHNRQPNAYSGLSMSM